MASSVLVLQNLNSIITWFYSWPMKTGFAFLFSSSWASWEFKVIKSIPMSPSWFVTSSLTKGLGLGRFCCSVSLVVKRQQGKRSGFEYGYVANLLCDPGQVTHGLWASGFSGLQEGERDRIHGPFQCGYVKVLRVDLGKIVQVKSITINGNQVQWFCRVLCKQSRTLCCFMYSSNACQALPLCWALARSGDTKINKGYMVPALKA